MSYTCAPTKAFGAVGDVRNVLKLEPVVTEETYNDKTVISKLCHCGGVEAQLKQNRRGTSPKSSMVSVIR